MNRPREHLDSLLRWLGRREGARFLHLHPRNILIQVRKKLTTSCTLFRHAGVSSRAEWKIQKLHFSKSERNFRTTSQHWFQNCFWNHDWTIILLRNLAKISYRKQRQIWNHDASQFQVISLKIGIETMFLQTTSQPWLQNSFWIHDPTLCLLSNSGNVFYRKHWVY